MHSTPQAAIAAYFDALNRSDAGALARLFSEDGCFMGDGSPTATGPQEIEAFARGAFEAIDCRHTYQIDRDDQRDGLAVVQTHSSGKVTLKAAGTTSDDAHRELFVLRDEGGGWRIAQYMFNGAVNGAGGEA